VPNLRIATRPMRSLQVGALGLGCLGMSEFYGPADWDESLRVIRHALDRGVTLVDTADIYGWGHNEVLVGRAIAGRRDEVVVSTKFGNDRLGSGMGVGRGDRDFVHRSCEASLLRLDVDAIDLYCLHRPPVNVPIEETVGAMAELVAAGKVREVGLSNVSAELVRRAASVHPIAAVENQYSLWARETESIAPTLAEHGIALVGYSPLGRGLLTDRFDRADLQPGDLRTKAVPTEPDRLAEADRIVARVRALAEAHSVSAAQVALAWVIGRTEALGVPVVPIPGIKSIQYVDENLAALDLLARLPEELDHLVDLGSASASA